VFTDCFGFPQAVCLSVLAFFWNSALLVLTFGLDFDYLKPKKEKCQMSSNDADDLKGELERLRAENERLKKGASKGTSLRVSEKGGVSVYGLGRFPVTLYKEQWKKLLDMADEIRRFIEDNDSQLKSKE